jgi:hypothetical protein
MASMLADRPSVKYSNLQREPRAISAAVDQGPLLVTRRDGAPLVLIREDELDAAWRGMELASSVLGLFLDDSPGLLADRLSGPFPWVTFLRDHEVGTYASELVATARACAVTGKYMPLLALVHGWQSTAEAYAAGWDGDDYEWLDDDGTGVPRPAH